MEILSQINCLYSCRESQISQLFEYLRQSSKTLIVYGLRSTAKTSVVKTMCEKSNSFNAYINCNEFFANKSIYENILIQLNDKINCFDSNPIVCNSLSDFIDDMKQILKTFADYYTQNRDQLAKTMPFSQCIIVLDSIDSNHHLFDGNHNELMTGLTNLEQLTRNVWPISCVLISCQSIEWFCRITSSPFTANQINFNTYSSEQLSHILSNDCPIGYDKQFYRNFVNIIVKTLIQLTRNLCEVRTACLANFAKYVEPIRSGQMTDKDSAKLFKRFQPILIQIIDEIPLKAVNKMCDSQEWPQSIQYLLIACYLSSYNSAKMDKKLFVKYEGKKKKERKPKNTTEEKQCVGAKAATFERVLHIYKAIIELNVENDEHLLSETSNKLLAQFEQLVCLKLIHRTQSTTKTSCLSSSTKFQISNSVTLESIRCLSQKLNLNIKAFIE